MEDYDLTKSKVYENMLYHIDTNTNSHFDNQNFLLF